MAMGSIDLNSFFLIANWVNTSPLLLKFWVLIFTYKCCLASIEIPIVEIRQPYDHLISRMGFPLLVRWEIPIVELRRSYDHFLFTMQFSVLVRQGIPIVDIRQCYHNLISTMWFPILIRSYLYWMGAQGPGACFHTKLPSYWNAKSHCVNETVVKLSHLHNGISYAGNMASLYWHQPLVLCVTRSSGALIHVLTLSVRVNLNTPANLINLQVMG